MFGPALITAYKFDEKNAPPRVTLHLDIVQDINKFGIRKDIIAIYPWDSSQMLHVLLDLGLADFDVHSQSQRLDRDALYFAFMMGRNTTDYSLPPSVRAKWRWLQHYWEKTVKEKSLTRFLAINKPWEDYKKIQL